MRLLTKTGGAFLHHLARGSDSILDTYDYPEELPLRTNVKNFIYLTVYEICLDCL